METKDRIKNIIEREGLTQVEFAERTGIKPPTLSHVLTGRNNPSTEVIQKILSAFPHYSGEWVLNGMGDMFSTSANMSHDPSVVSLFGGQEEFDPNFRNGTHPLASPQSSALDTRFRPVTASTSTQHYTPPSLPDTEQAKRTVTKIIVFYDDNTYETFIHGEEKKGK